MFHNKQRTVNLIQCGLPALHCRFRFRQRVAAELNSLDLRPTSCDLLVVVSYRRSSSQVVDTRRLRVLLNARPSAWNALLGISKTVHSLCLLLDVS